MRSEEELCQRLKRRKLDQETIARVILFLKKNGFIDDMEFSRAWLNDKIKRPLGIRRISEELRRKGVDRKIIEQTLAAALDNYDEKSVVLELARRRFKKLFSHKPKNIKVRLYSYLLRRGFSPDVIWEVINQL